MLIGTGVVLVAAVVAWQAQSTLWTANSNRVGRALIDRFKSTQAAAPVKPTGSGASTGSLASCGESPASDGVQGLLVVPKLGVTAPVLQGLQDAQLNVAVGHDQYSVWPGKTGNAVLRGP